jgi:RNA polymerase sigma factor (sigma-70 family)
VTAVEDPSLSLTTDAESIRSSLEDPNAFGAVFDRHFDAIYRFLRGRVGDALADELAAETFTKAFDARRRYDLEHVDARPWLYAIATNLVHGHRRAERRKLAAYARLDATDGREDADAVDRLDASRRAPAISKALLKLKRRDRDTLLLVAWADLTYEEAARSLGVPVGTVRSRINRARSQVRAALEEDHG